MMLNFFRRIRERIVEENKPMRYLKYAIGEIILVVIGILIALQINNWNHQRLDHIEKDKIIKNLRNDFMQNQFQLRKSIRGNDNSIEAGTRLIRLMGAELSVLKEHNLDSLLFSTFPANEYIPSSNAIENIIQSGRLSLVNNEELAKLLAAWTTTMAMLQDRDEEADNWATNHFLPYLNKHISWREVDNNGNYPWSGKSKLKKDYYYIFEDLEFENLMDNYLFFLEQNNIWYKKGDSIATIIIHETEKK